MDILIGLATALSLLYFWIIGHWFGRVILFLPLGLAGMIAGLSPATMNHPPNYGAALILTPILVALAWLFASIPIYLRRRRGLGPRFGF